MINKETWIWMDGHLVPWEDAKVHVLSHTLHYGYGVFEGIRAYHHKDGRSAIFRLTEHSQRLLDSAKLLELSVPFSLKEICAACTQTMSANGMAEGYLRPLVFLGDKEVGVYPGDNPDVRLSVIAWQWGAYLGAEALNSGIRVKVSSYTKAHLNSLLLKGKVCGGYVNSVLTKMEAKREGYTEGILLDESGHVAEGSGENIFVVKAGVLFTPGDDAAILKGITRDSIIQLAQDLGLTVEKTPLTRSELYTADEMFFTGTAAEITPIREVDRRAIGDGHPGPITKRLQTAFFEILQGENKAYDHWMTYYDAGKPKAG